MAERIWTQRDQRLMTIAIGTEVVARCRAQGRRWTDLSADELRLMRYRIHLDLTTGRTAAEARAKRAALDRALDAGRVPTLARALSPVAA